MPPHPIAECLASNLETHVECVPRPRQWVGFPATKPAEMPLFHSGANSSLPQMVTTLVTQLPWTDEELEGFISEIDRVRLERKKK
jgi:hypothetical protein